MILIISLVYIRSQKKHSPSVQTLWLMFHFSRSSGISASESHQPWIFLATCLVILSPSHLAWIKTSPIATWCNMWQAPPKHLKPMTIHCSTSLVFKSYLTKHTLPFIYHPPVLPPQKLTLWSFDKFPTSLSNRWWNCEAHQCAATALPRRPVKRA